MSEDDTERAPFLSRWSRRKIAAREGKPLPEPETTGTAPEPRAREEGTLHSAAAGTSAGAAPAADEQAAAELPAIESLKGLTSDYQEFMRPDVDTATRSAALRKLFGDPHFNAMDGLDVYIDDYSKPDPIPAAMLKTLHHARSLLGFPDEEAATAPGDAVSAGVTEAAPAEAPHVAGPQQAVEAPREDARELNTPTAVRDGQNVAGPPVVPDLTEPAPPSDRSA
jgi:hypothetical protein